METTPPSGTTMQAADLSWPTAASTVTGYNPVTSSVAGDDSEAVPVAEIDGFDAFYRKEFPAMVALASTMAGPAIAEDLAQEAMVRAHRNWRRISGYDAPGAWIRRVTINLATSALRRRAVEVKSRLRIGHRPDREPPIDMSDAEPLWAAVAKLAPQQRAAIALHYLEDRPVREIAVILECAESTAKVHLHKARQNLAEALGHDRNAA